MPDTKTNELAVNNAGTQGGYTDITMWVGDPSDVSKGDLINNEMIDGFTITENIFYVRAYAHKTNKYLLIIILLAEHYLQYSLKTML